MMSTSSNMAEDRDLSDFSEVMGQENVKRALEIAAAGGHNVLLVGAPGSGKSMLARRLPSILPDMTRSESLETTEIYSVAGMTDPKHPLVDRRPFRSPHHTASPVSLSGGGSVPRPGEISLSHNGILFLDELPEFDKSALETLRQPLEDGVITITRATGSLTLPSRFMLVQETNSQWQGSLMKDSSCRKKWRFVCGVIKSNDNGKSFSYHGFIHHPADCHHWEPDITELENGHLLMYIRCESPENVLWQSESFDYGKTWSNSVPTDIPSAGSKEMICDIEGRKVMFFNHVTPDAVNRNTLAAWTSSDNCRTWYRKNVIAKLNDYTGELEEMYKGKIHPVQVAYPHVFADNEKRLVYLAIDSVYKFYLMKIPFDELI